ncbi:MAG: cupin, partial [Trichococcus flocculiformis]|nr:cupin [Trichococcus flocculiformis]
AHLILCHWGTVDAPDLNVFNADPQSLYDRVVNPERIHAYAPGQPFSLKKS